MFAKGADSVVEARLGSADWNLQDGGGFFKRKVVLIVEKEDGPAGGRNVVAVQFHVERSHRPGLWPSLHYISGSEWAANVLKLDDDAKNG